jgi:hypothetical protein
MAKEFLADAGRGSGEWEHSWRSGNQSVVGLEIHRGKGGASLFGGWERRGMPPVDPGLIPAELDKAEAALADLLGKV